MFSKKADLNEVEDVNAVEGGDAVTEDTVNEDPNLAAVEALGWKIAHNDPRYFTGAQLRAEKKLPGATRIKMIGSNSPAGLLAQAVSAEKWNEKVLAQRDKIASRDERQTEIHKNGERA